jgi:hypothetical protein
MAGLLPTTSLMKTLPHSTLLATFFALSESFENTDPLNPY